MIPCPNFIIDFREDRPLIIWANKAQLELWGKSQEEIENFDITNHVDIHTLNTLKTAYENYKNGGVEVYQHYADFSFVENPSLTHVYLFGPVQVEHRVCVFVSILKETISMPKEDTRLFEIARKYVNTHLSLYNKEGNIIMRNLSEKKRFISQKPQNLKIHFESDNISDLILKKFGSAQISEKIFEKETLVRDEKETLVFLSEVYCVENTFTHEKEILIHEVDVTKISKMSTFIAKTSHDIRTPLNGIMGILQCLNIKNLPEDIKGSIEIALSSSRSLIDLLNDIIDISKIQSGAFSLNQHQTYIKTLLNLIYEIANTNYLRINPFVELIIEEQPDLISSNDGMSIDVLRVRQILNNLLSNAIKFTKRGYIKIGLHYYEQEDKIRLFCEDTGIGISKEKQKLIFEDFGQSRKEDSEIGTGLGLSIVKSLTELMGGTIGLESEVGKGSLFYVDLPVNHKLVYQKCEKQDMKILMIGENNYSNQNLVNILKEFTPVDFKKIEEVTSVDNYYDYVFIDDVRETNIFEISNLIKKIKNTIIVPIISHNDFLSEMKNFLNISYVIIKPVKPSKVMALILNKKGLEENEEWKKTPEKAILYENNPLESKNLLNVFFQKIIEVRTFKELKEIVLNDGITFIFISFPIEVSIEIVKSIRNYEKTFTKDPYLIIIVISIPTLGDSEKEKVLALKSGANEYIKKPIFFENIAAIIAKWINPSTKFKEILSGYRILIIDDNSINRLVLEKMINSFGNNKIEWAQNGREGIEKCKNSTYSIVFLDINLPDMDGFKVERTLRNIYKIHVPIIAFTGSSADMYEFDDVLYKPVHIDELVKILLKWCVSSDKLPPIFIKQHMKVKSTKIPSSIDSILLPEWLNRKSDYTEENLKFFDLLPIPIHILTLTGNSEKLKVHWGNSACVNFWKKKDLNDFLLNHQFNDVSPQNLQQMTDIMHYYEEGKKEIFTQQFVFYPNGKATSIQMSISPIYVKSGGVTKMGLLVCYYPKELDMGNDDQRLFHIFKLYNLHSLYISIYDINGGIIIQKNKNLKDKKCLKDHLGQKLSERILDLVPKCEFGQKILSTEYSINNKVFHSEIYIIKDPVTGNRVILVEEQDSTNIFETISFISKLSHELRTPLNGVIGVLQYLNLNVHTERNMIQSALDSANNLYKILENLVELSRVESGFIDIFSEAISVDNILITLENLVDDNDNVILYSPLELYHSKTKITIDLSFLEQIFAKLWSFCLKTQKGLIYVHLKIKNVLPSAYIKLKIHDSQLVLTQEAIDKLLDKTQLIDSKSFNSSNLSLIVCKVLVNVLSGKFSIKSGLEGTKYKVKIPIACPIEISGFKKYSFEQILIISDKQKFIDYLYKLLTPINLICSHQTFKDKFELDPNLAFTILDDPPDSFLEQNFKVDTIIISKRENLSYQTVKPPIRPLRLIEKIDEILIQKKSLVENLSEHHYSFLIVEDNKINQLVLNKLVKNLYKHCDIDIANNGEEGVDLFKKKHYSMIFIDINMPIKNGIETAIEIRKIDKDIPILAVTANVSNEKKRISEAGINDILLKPIIFQALKSKCTSLLTNK